MHRAPRVSIHVYSDANLDSPTPPRARLPLANAAIDWIKKKQQSIALNTMEAEIMSGSPLRATLSRPGHLRGGRLPAVRGETRLFMDSTSGIVSSPTTRG